MGSLAAITEIPTREAPAAGIVSTPFNVVASYLLNVQQNDFKKFIAPRSQERKESHPNFELF
jgi:hypothetical protein